MTARRCLGLVALLAVAPAPAFAKDICSALAEIAASARETPAFDSVRHALANGQAVVPGFQVGDCRVSAAALACDDISFNAANFDGWPEPLNCAGLTPVPPSGQRPGRRDRRHAWLLAGLRIEYGFSCWGCAGGPHSFFHAGFDGQGRPGE
jgi:hypothetical protein